MKMVPFDEHAQAIARRQYMQEGDGDVFGMFRRVANWVALPEKEAERERWAQRFYELMATKRFCPGGRVLAGAGTAHGNVLNCFVQGATQHPPASFEGIMEVAEKLALVTKVGGGNGVNLDPYVSRGATKRTGTVRGWAYLRADHPDVEDFIKGLMRPPTNPDGDKEQITVRNWTRVVYGLLPPEHAALARRHGVLTVRERPADALEVPDDMGGIIRSAAQAVAQAKEGYEPHVDFSQLRPEGAPIKGSGGTSSGPVSFLLEIFDNFLEWANLGAEAAGPVATLRYVYAPVLRVVRQGGTRRGAGMATLSIDHPDLLDFLTAKDLDREAAEGDISTFNISILVTDTFWKALEADALWPVTPVEVPGKYYPYPLEEPYTGTLPELPDREADGARAIPLYDGKVPAKWLWHEIAWHAWATGEPGLIFIDRVNDLSALKGLGERYRIRSTNPCGEIPLTVGEPCDLGAMNLAAYVREGAFDFEAFRRDVRIAVRFLDNVLDVNKFALEDNRAASQKLRRLGLGVMGLADALIKMGLPYDSEAAREQVYEIMSVLREEAIRASEALAEERGVFPLYAEEQAYFEKLGIRPRRNVALLTVAPTGTTSMLMGVSSGIEPVYSPFVWRRIGSEYKPLLHPLFQELMAQFPPHPEYAKDGGWDWDKLIEAIQENHGSVEGLEMIPEAIRRVFRCAHDVAPLDHVRMQGVVQRAFDAEGYAGNSLSKTINLPNEASVADVEAAYTEAYRTGCKGITVYRDGSREFQVLSVKKEEKEAKTPQPASASSEPAAPTSRPGKPLYERTGRLVGFTDMVKLTAADGTRRSFLVTINMQGEHPIEVIVTSGKAGDEANADSEALGRVVSIALQYGVPPEAIIKTLRGINGGLYGSYQGRLVASKADLIAVALETASGVSLELQPQPQTPKAQPVPVPATGKSSACPECGSESLVREEGCVKCPACGYSKCG
ncbi:adenosylcobalamin-dependent ribonucleoside-diphosphate reductase [Marinithermus hydrothermalis]|uniref:Vitamin B12-dependent ribonucleotide reductase n=1 Tax=Marinithermus hydrothermalis (strain DSM 14884 / JCM 11576 / T1) TaxID=869210 RepID=F2NKB1_MARHT|nr:adenosylcobalamin-dependent ribonucleoside-diphosphate reductase [Marinithermus hydrothermalis]AEB12360.1 ribonucleoside-diphosphate reductase, adenosylcobalamin-dependent [Marinithermus hydrothermalis DSM 14884]